MFTQQDSPWVASSHTASADSLRLSPEPSEDSSIEDLNNKHINKHTYIIQYNVQHQSDYEHGVPVALTLRVRRTADIISAGCETITDTSSRFSVTNKSNSAPE